MSDVTIPEGVKYAANQVAVRIFDDAMEEGEYGLEINQALIEQFVAEAILAERERCAKIADACFADIKGYPHDFGALDTGGLRAAEKIAQAIRSPHPNDEGDGK